MNRRAFLTALGAVLAALGLKRPAPANAAAPPKIGLRDVPPAGVYRQDFNDRIEIDRGTLTFPSGRLVPFQDAVIEYRQLVHRTPDGQVFGGRRQGTLTIGSMPALAVADYRRCSDVLSPQVIGVEADGLRAALGFAVMTSLPAAANADGLVRGVAFMFCRLDIVRPVRPAHVRQTCCLPGCNRLSTHWVGATHHDTTYACDRHVGLLAGPSGRLAKPGVV